MGRQAANHPKPSKAKHYKPHPSPLGGRTIRRARPVPQNNVGKHYPAEFNADALALYQSRPGATIKSVAGDLGVNTETLRNWTRAADGRRPGAHSSAPAAARDGGDDVQAELAAARKRIAELEEERDILRKAARYFATETRW
ncbi:transposase [Streptomyces erythrochromogenes]|uniref:transposase n=1 Tax=Streptomyces erythrochromogenes TaxID=285574 RepID=UPI00380BBC63